MILHDLFFLITIGVQFALVWLLTAKIWFPQVPFVAAAIGQGFIALCVTALLAGALSSMLWITVIAYPALFTWIDAVPSDPEAALKAMRDNRGVTLFIVISPYLYMVIRLYELILHRRQT